MVEHPEVSRVKVELREALGEAPMCVGAQLRQQEAGTVIHSLRRGCLRGRHVSAHCFFKDTELV
jgi:hypothetical protein